MAAAAVLGTVLSVGDGTYGDVYMRSRFLPDKLDQRVAQGLLGFAPRRQCLPSTRGGAA